MMLVCGLSPDCQIVRLEVGAVIHWRANAFEVVSFDATGLVLQRRHLVKDEDPHRFALLTEVQKRSKDIDDLNKAEEEEEEQPDEKSAERASLELMAQTHKRRIDVITNEACARKYRIVDVKLRPYQLSAMDLAYWPAGYPAHVHVEVPEIVNVEHVWTPTAPWKLGRVPEGFVNVILAPGCVVLSSAVKHCRWPLDWDRGVGGAQLDTCPNRAVALLDDPFPLTLLTLDAGDSMSVRCLNFHTMKQEAQPKCRALEPKLLALGFSGSCIATLEEEKGCEPEVRVYSCAPAFR